jgi:hypothetical protein
MATSKLPMPQNELQAQAQITSALQDVSNELQLIRAELNAILAVLQTMKPK